MALETSEDLGKKVESIDVESLDYDCESGSTVAVPCRRCGVFGHGNELLFFFLILVILYNQLYYN